MTAQSEEVYSKSKLHGLWALTNRELKKWYQSPITLIMGIIQPMIWLTFQGKAMNLTALIPTNIPGLNSATVLQDMMGTTDYFSFMAMGMVAFTVVFTTAFVGMSVVWDRRLGFLNKVLSTPVSRTVIILSKVFSATIRSMFQASIVAIVAYILGLQLGANFTAFSILGIFAMVFLIGVGLSSMFIAFTLRSTRMETPQAIFNLISLPLMFTSNAFFPTKFMPSWLQAIANVNPISYANDAVRRLMVFSDGSAPLMLDFTYVGIFAVIVTAICIVLSWRFLNK
jgi:ABC-2 type transport system permease protein